MGRTSLAPERRVHILHAVISCMAQFGMKGTTLDRVADEANMARGHIRHYVGNRDEMIVDAAKVFFFGDVAANAVSLDEIDPCAGNASPEMTVLELLDYLFGDFAETGDENYAASAFIGAALAEAEVQTVVQLFYRTLESTIQKVIQRAHPEATPSDVRQVAYGVFTLAYGNTAVAEIDNAWGESLLGRAAAERLLRTLNSSAKEQMTQL